MMQPSDKELDKLISDAAGQYEASGAVPNWEEMQALLDEQLPVKKDPRRRPFILWLLFIVLLLGGGYFYFNNNNKPGDVVSYTTKESNKPAKTNNNNDQPGIAIPGKTNEDTTEEIQTEKPATNILPTTSSAGIPQNDQTSINKSNHLKGRKAGNTRLNTSMGETGEPDLISTIEDAPVIEDTNIAPARQPVVAPEPLLQKEPSVINGKKDDKTPGEIVKNGEKEKVDTNRIVPGKKNKKTDNKRKNPFEISLLYAPELTTIKYSNYDKPGSNYGILIGYNILKNISIQTGIIKSKKNYTANGEDFKTNYYVTPPYKLTKVSGYCNMYEIPLNIKYQLSHGKKINIHALAGVSSYFMTGETYTYQYTSNSNSYNRTNHYNSQQNHWLSVATIGMGFEKEISKKLTFGATPFAKIPFKGMGTGDLKLSGMGINFSLSYRPSFTK